jgi:hypothetical protein
MPKAELTPDRTTPPRSENGPGLRGSHPRSRITGALCAYHLAKAGMDLAAPDKLDVASARWYYTPLDKSKMDVKSQVDACPYSNLFDR